MDTFWKILRIIAKVILFFLVLCVSFILLLIITPTSETGEMSTSSVLSLLLSPIILACLSVSPLVWKKTRHADGKRIAKEDQKVIDNFRQSVDHLLNTPRPAPLTKEEYQAIRNAEAEWLEDHYDFSTVESVSRIPERMDLPRPPGDSPTGDVYYYLRYKARLYEESGAVELAIACMRKSIALMQLKYGDVYGKEECYSFVRMLVRNGYTQEARSAKERFDSYYSGGLDRMQLRSFQSICRQAADLNTDLLIMMSHASTCPECARFQGRVYSLSGKSKLFPPIPHTVLETGVIHPGCHHQFSPYIHKVTNAHMDYTLQLHPLKNPRYGRDIITFSNRPFVDDRTDECKATAEIAREKRRIEKLNKQRRDEVIIEQEIQKRNDYQDFEWLKAHFPEKCPASPSGYRRMKNQNTKNYQALKQLAAERGKYI